jgi:hypothetical protein
VPPFASAKNLKKSCKKGPFASMDCIVLKINSTHFWCMCQRLGYIYIERERDGEDRGNILETRKDLKQSM